MTHEEKSANMASHEFQAAFRRSLLLHRKGRYSFFYHVQFPGSEKSPYRDVDPVLHLDFRNWLSMPPADTIADNRHYRKLIDRQDALLTLVRLALDEAAAARLTEARYVAVLGAMYEFDHAADQLMASITTALTDIDELTGVLNRTALERDIDKLSGEAVDRTLALAMIDADHFKRVNDTWGHPVGDGVLTQLAERFAASLRPQDRLYRYGGEEFLVILPDTDVCKALPVMERLRLRACGTPMTHDELHIEQSVSVGLAQRRPDESLHDAIERADRALYRAKQAGRNRVMADD